MRRLFALLLIATSGWLLHQTVGHNLAGVGHSFWRELASQAEKPAFLVPTIGGALGLLGVADAQLDAVSFGKEKPAVQGSDEASMAKNRRVEVTYRP